MTNTPCRWLRKLALPALFVALASCGDALPVTPLAPAGSGPRLSTGSGAAFLVCPATESRSFSFTLSDVGGTVEANGYKLVVPAGAVLTPTTFTLTIPASRYMEVRLTAGNAQHFSFARPISVTLNYARCSGEKTDPYALRVFYVDSESRAVLQDMGGVDDKGRRSVTFVTDHFSDYILGTN